MISISLCMIVKNEEEHIRDCLESVKNIVDEIIIVDTGSEDHTKDIVKEYTEKVYEFCWVDDFAAARNYSFSKATKDFTMWLDADDLILPKDATELLKLKKELTMDMDIDCVSCIYNYAFDENGKPSLTFRRERIVRTSKRFQWVGFIHEYIQTNGKQITSDVCVTHNRVHGNSDRNLIIYRNKIKEGVLLTVRDQYYYAKELYYHSLWDEAIIEFEQYLQSYSWIEDRIDAVNCLANCYIKKDMLKKAREILFEAFHIAIPRAETLYTLAMTFQQEKKYEEAIYWYEMIFHTPKPKTAGFVFDEYWTWRPHLELCVCYSRLGNNDLALKQNTMASQYNKDHPAIKSNFEYFLSLHKGSSIS